MKRKEFWILALFALVIIAFFWDLATLKHAFLSGDHREQQYPWAKFYQEQIRHFRLPWWTGDIHCGFPILAEGQIGAFYPLNYLFFLVLPVKIAYNYIILFQYWLGASFFYWFLRRLKVSVFSSFLAGLIFLFGSGQGGYFYYNYISQKVVIWLPLTLILIDRLREQKKWQDAFWLGAVFAVQIFGGYLQVAIYSIFYSCVYFLYRFSQDRTRKFFLFFCAAGILGIFFSLIQLLPTFELSLLSSRADAPKGLAYVGSMNPAGFLTLFYPAWDGFLGSEFYLGLAGLFFAFIGFWGQKSKDHKFFVGAGVLFLLLALGSFSPLYRLIVEGTGFNGFRTPIKFLFFVTFSFTVLAAFGADKLFMKLLGEQKIRTASAVFSVLTLLALAFPFFTSRALTTNKAQWLPKFEDMTVKTFFSKAGHPHSEEDYRQKARGYYEAVLQTLDFNQRDARNQFALLSILLAFCLVLCVRPRPGRVFAVLITAFLIADLYLYGFTSIKAGEEPFDTIDVPGKSSIIDYLKKDGDLFRVMEVYEKPEENRLFPIFPSWNMLDHIQDTGAYSPLVMKAYKNFMTGIGYINDSLSVLFVDPAKLKERRTDLDFLNVKYLLSREPLNLPDLEPVLTEGDVTLYQNKTVLPRFYFLPAKDSFEKPDRANIRPVSVDQYWDTQIKVHFEAPEDGNLVSSELYYQSWTAQTNGHEGKLYRIRNLFRAVQVLKGSNEIVIEYETGIFKTAGVTALFVFIFGLAEMLLASRRARLQNPI